MSLNGSLCGFVSFFSISSVYDAIWNTFFKGQNSIDLKRIATYSEFYEENTIEIDKTKDESISNLRKSESARLQNLRQEKSKLIKKNSTEQVKVIENKPQSTLGGELNSKNSTQSQ